MHKIRTLDGASELRYAVCNFMQGGASKMNKRIPSFVVGLLCGAVMFGGVTAAAAADIIAKPTWQKIYVDGQQVEMAAYNINGSNYVKLRDIGKAVGFNVYWQDGVQVDTTTDYTGEAPAQSSAASTAASDIDAVRQEIVDRTNALRQSKGLSALRVDDKLTQAAQVRADEMAATTTYSHTRPDGSQFYTVTDCPYMSENVHRISGWRVQQNGNIAELAVSEWAASEGHLKNILNDDLSDIGVGIAKGVNANGDDCWYVVQLFIHKGYTVTWVDEPITQK
jgi:uncharacterized protein YkwD